MTPVNSLEFAGFRRAVGYEDQAVRLRLRLRCDRLFPFRLVGVVAAGLLEGAAQEELDLRIETAQIIVRPALDGLQQSRVNAKQEGFAVSH